MGTSNFNYNNMEVKQQNGGKVVRKVSIKNGKGYKSITKYYKGKKVSSVKKPICKSHILSIKMCKFVPGLFADCKCNKTRRRKN